MLHKNKVRRYRPITIFKAEGFLHNIPTEFGIFQGGFFWQRNQNIFGDFLKNYFVNWPNFRNLQCSVFTPGR